MKLKKKVKGFTLIELIVVMALFGIIMFAAMSLMTPTGKIMNTTYSMEQKASTLLNAKDYLEQTFRYAEYIQISDADLNNQADLQRFVHEHYAGKVRQDEHGNIVYSSGQVHVMRIDNTNHGQISTWTYNYQAGDQRADTDPTNDDPSVVNMTPVAHEDWAINRANYTDNWYRFALGIYQLDEKISSGMLVPNLDVMKPDTAGGLGAFGRNNFSISVVSYPADNAKNQAKGITQEASGRYPQASVSVAATTLPNIVDNREHTAWNWQDEIDPFTSLPTGNRVIKEDPDKNGSKLTIANNGDNAFEIDPVLLDANGCCQFDTLYIIYSYMDSADIIK